MGTQNSTKECFEIDWAAIRDEISLTEVIHAFGGKIKKGCFCCPAHNDKNHPSAKLSKNKGGQRWVCFTCGEGGSNIDYVMFALGVSKDEAALHLGGMYGVGISESMALESYEIIPKDVLKAIGLTKNPFFPAKVRAVIPVEKFGDMEDIPKAGYSKNMGSMELTPDEAAIVVAGKCMEYLQNTPGNSAMRREVDKVLSKMKKVIANSKDKYEENEIELGA